MKSFKVIRDPLHGDIGLSRLELDLLDTPQMQRLRRVKQNGFCFLVYPAMNSTRFEHSLGVMHLAGILCERLDLSADETAVVRAAGLLHDVGHTPFSHSTEKALKSRGYGHEEVSVKLVKTSPISEVLTEHSIDPGVVSNLVLGEGRFGGIISSQIDVDKMDYLIRDAYYAGVAYGVTDIERVMQCVRLSRKGLFIEEDGLEAVESLLVNRNLMYQTVYRHHTKRIGEAMFHHALEYLLEEGLSTDELIQLDDVALTSLMRADKGYAGRVAGRLDSRRLHKTVLCEKIMEMDDEFRERLVDKPSVLEEEIVEDMGLSLGELIVDYPEIKMSEFKVNVMSDAGLKPIDEVSSLARSLEESEQDRLEFNIYCDPLVVEKSPEISLEKYIHYKQTRIESFI